MFVRRANVQITAAFIAEALTRENITPGQAAARCLSVERMILRYQNFENS